MLKPLEFGLAHFYTNNTTKEENAKYFAHTMCFDRGLTELENYSILASFKYYDYDYYDEYDYDNYDYNDNYDNDHDDDNDDDDDYYDEYDYNDDNYDYDNDVYNDNDYNNFNDYDDYNYNPMLVKPGIHYVQVKKDKLNNTS